MNKDTMEIEVEYKNAKGIISRPIYNLTRIAFAKHFAIAGQHYAPRPQKLIRAIAMFFHYSYYLQRHAFYNNRFSEPPMQLSDPTEKGQFSNLAGKAIADFLSKRIDKSLYTVNYEAAMLDNGMSIEGKRPDLLAFINQHSRFAIEAKGFSGSFGNMNDHKNQSKAGAIPVDFTVACVSYNLYTKVECKYYDPHNKEISYDNELLRKLTQSYYSGLLEFLNEEYFKYEEIKVQGEKFYKVELSNSSYKELFYDQFPFWHCCIHEIFEHYRPKLILPIDIKDYAENGIVKGVEPFILEESQKQDMYIDNDKIGLQVEDEKYSPFLRCSH